VRGTSRSPDARAEMQAAGIEAAEADPDRLGTILPLLQGVSAVGWLMGTARGSPDAVAALHGPRLRSLQEKLVDSGVRGLVYEAGGSVDPELVAGGAAVVREVGETFRMPVAVVDDHPADLGAWRGAMLRAVAEVLAA
jgi:hypothetical protein